MSVNEIQALATQFADAFDQRDLKTFLGMFRMTWRCSTTFRTDSTANRSSPRLSENRARAYGRLEVHHDY
jgi:hypothetical protein